MAVPIAPKKPLPEGTEPCDGCHGRGIYYGRGHVENGQWVGFSGPCFRCNSKGWQTPKDKQRNVYYDTHVRRIEP